MLICGLYSLLFVKCESIPLKHFRMHYSTSCQSMVFIFNWLDLVSDSIISNIPFIHHSLLSLSMTFALRFLRVGSNSYTLLLIFSLIFATKAILSWNLADFKEIWKFLIILDDNPFELVHIHAQNFQYYRLKVSRSFC